MKLGCTDKAFGLYGLNHVDCEKGEFWRLPADVLARLPQLGDLGRRCGGGRVRFTTDSPTVMVRYVLATEEVDRAIGLPGAAGVDVYLGSGLASRYAGYVAPAEYGYKGKTIEGTIEKAPKPQVVTLNLPRNELLAFIEVELAPGAGAEPAGYAIEQPIVYYGSSITEGGCAPRPGNAYTSIVSRWLDADYYNYGFSGSAKGEPEFAQFIAQHEDMSLFVYDYDHNAPTPEHLAATHAPFLQVIRKRHPTLPVVMLTRPDFDREPEDSLRRRSIVYGTFAACVEKGDENVYFIDGQQFFGPAGRAECTVDGCHPNALGFMRMAERVYPLAKQILGAAGHAPA